MIYEGGDLILEMSYVVAKQESHAAEISAIEAFETGFMLGLDSGVVVIFKKTDDHYMYMKMNEIRLEDSGVSWFTFSPHQELAVISLANSQLYKIHIEMAQIEAPNEEVRCDRLADSYHSGAITGLDLSMNKPVVVTSSHDNSLRIWNYLDHGVEVVRFFEEPASSIAIHPNGLYLLAAFPSGIQLMAIMLDDVKTFWESASFRDCGSCTFARGGHKFAATWNTSVIVFDTWTFEMQANIKATAGVFRDLKWSPNDLSLLVHATDGIAQWCVATKTRDFVLDCQDLEVHSVTYNETGRFIYASCGNGIIKVFKDGKLVNEVKAPTVLYNLSLSNSGQILVASDEFGSVYTLPFPLDKGTLINASQHPMHHGPVRALKFSTDDQTMISIGDDGCLWVYNIHDKTVDKKQCRDRDLMYSNEILVSKTDLAENTKLLNELKARVEALRIESEMQQEEKSMFYAGKLQETCSRFQSEIDGLNEALALRKEETVQGDERRTLEMKKLKESHKLDMSEIEASFTDKMKVEMRRFKELTTRLEVLRQQWQLRMEQIGTQQKSKEGEMKEYYARKLKEQQLLIVDFKKQFEVIKENHEQHVRDIEEDCEKEILQLEYSYQLKLKAEASIRVKAANENINMKSIYDGLFSQIDDQKRELAKATLEEGRIQNVVHALHHDIEQLLKEV